MQSVEDLNIGIHKEIKIGLCDAALEGAEYLERVMKGRYKEEAKEQDSRETKNQLILEMIDAGTRDIELIDIPLEELRAKALNYVTEIEALNLKNFFEDYVLRGIKLGKTKLDIRGAHVTKNNMIAVVAKLRRCLAMLTIGCFRTSRALRHCGVIVGLAERLYDMRFDVDFIVSAGIRSGNDSDLREVTALATDYDHLVALSETKGHVVTDEEVNKVQDAYTTLMQRYELQYDSILSPLNGLNVNRCELFQLMFRVRKGLRDTEDFSPELHDAFRNLEAAIFRDMHTMLTLKDNNETKLRAAAVGVIVKGYVEDLENMLMALIEARVFERERSNAVKAEEVAKFWRVSLAAALSANHVTICSMPGMRTAIWSLMGRLDSVNPEQKTKFEKAVQKLAPRLLL